MPISKKLDPIFKMKESNTINEYANEESRLACDDSINKNIEVDTVMRHITSGKMPFLGIPTVMISKSKDI